MIGQPHCEPVSSQDHARQTESGGRLWQAPSMQAPSSLVTQPENRNLKVLFLRQFHSIVNLPHRRAFETLNCRSSEQDDPPSFIRPIRFKRFSVFNLAPKLSARKPFAKKFLISLLDFLKIGESRLSSFCGCLRSQAVAQGKPPTLSALLRPFT